MTGTPQEHRLPADLAAPALSRRLLRAWLDGDTRTETAVLALDELVANAVRHGNLDPEEDEITIWMDHRDGGGLRFTVGHPGRPFAVPPLPRRDGEFSGLTIVDTIASRWSIEGEGSMVHVWFEMSASPENGSGRGSWSRPEPSLTTLIIAPAEEELP